MIIDVPVVLSIVVCLALIAIAVKGFKDSSRSNKKDNNNNKQA